MVVIRLSNNNNLISLAGKLILTASLCFLATSCKQVPKSVQAEPSNPQAKEQGAAKVIGTIKNPSVNESSGLVASRTFPGAYWTHNDSGDGPFLYALNGRGESLGVWRIPNAKNDDWEDMSIGAGREGGKSYLYIGDIGDNDARRPSVVVYRVLEPTPTAEDAKSTRLKPQLTEQAEVIRLSYPDEKHDAETLLVHPTNGNIYIITKVALQNPSIYEAIPPFDLTKPITMRRLGELKLPSLFGGILTGGSVSPDGKRVALCDYFQGFELLLPSNAKSFDEIWKQRMVSFDFGKRKQGEAIAYRLDGKAVVGTSEGRKSEMVQVER